MEQPYGSSKFVITDILHLFNFYKGQICPSGK